MKKNVLRWLIPALVLLNACKKDDDDGGTRIPVAAAKGLYILSEGNFGANNTRLGFYTFATGSVTGDYYVQQNPSAPAILGDTGNDMIIYGGKLYVVMNVSSQVVVLNASTGALLKRIDFLNGGVPKEPRYATGASGKVFVTAYDGTVSVIDTTALSIGQSITVGSNPEGIVESNGKLYVANSGGLSATFDSTISIINLTTFAESKIRVGINPVSITADNAGNIYVGCLGNYSSIAPKLVKVNGASNTVIKSVDTAIGKFRYYDNKLYVTGGYLGLPNVRKLNTTDFHQDAANFITDGTLVISPYGIEVNEENGDVYIMGAKNYTTSGEVFCFDKTGKKKFSFTTSPGVSPSKVVFTR